MAEFNKYYGLSENPFGDSPDPKFYFSSEPHSETLASMQYGINQRKGFILILGEAGIGKTAVIQYLIKTLDDKVRTVYIDEGHTSFEHMLKDILAKLGLTLKRQTKGMMFHELYNFLIQCLERNENVVVIIDDAHKVSLDTVEELRLMSNLETSKSKLLQIILVGQPELNTKLSSEIIRQIKQRIVIRNSIRPLTISESLQYIDHRMNLAGRMSQAVFTQEALSLICKYAEGIPRTINILCHNALSVGYRRAEKMISAQTVRKVRHIKDLLTDERAQLFKPPQKVVLPVKYSLAFLVVVAIAGTLFLYHDRIVNVMAGIKTKASEEYSAIKDNDRTSVTKGKPTAAPEQISSSDSGMKQAKTPVTVPASMSACNAKPEFRIKKIIIVKRGLSLSLLALQYYNEPNIMLIDYILELNPEITDLDLIQVNQKIKLPEVIGQQFLIQSSNNVCKIHLETFASPDDASQYKKQAVFKGRNIEIVPRRVSPRETWYRVFAGPFSNKEEAQQLFQELKKSGLAPSLQRLSNSNR